MPISRSQSCWRTAPSTGRRSMWRALDYDRMQQAIKTAPDLVTPQTIGPRAGQAGSRAGPARPGQHAAALCPHHRAFFRHHHRPLCRSRRLHSGADQQRPEAAPPIVSLMDFSRVRVQIPVPEDEALRIIKGTPASFTVQGLSRTNLPRHRSRASAMRWTRAPRRCWRKSTWTIRAECCGRACMPPSC